MRQFASGRSDASDEKELFEFGAKIRERLLSGEKSEELQVPGNVPYKERHTSPMVPKVTDACVKCGRCVRPLRQRRRSVFPACAASRCALKAQELLTKSCLRGWCPGLRRSAADTGKISCFCKTPLRAGNYSPSSPPGPSFRGRLDSGRGSVIQESLGRWISGRGF